MKQFTKRIAMGLGILLAVAAVLAVVTKPKETAWASGINSCEISDDRGSIRVNVNVEATATDNGKLYLFAQDVYEDALTDKTVVSIADYSTNVSNYTFYIPFEDGTLLYKKYVAAVLQSGNFVKVTGEYYITNPEQIAAYTAPKAVSDTKKGTSASLAALEDLNCKNGFLDIMFEDIIAGFQAGNSAGADNTIYYNGYTYYFNTEKIQTLDHVISSMCEKGIVVTASLNAATTLDGTYSQFLCSPNATARDGVTYYGFNTENFNGQNMVIAITRYLAQRYSDSSSEHGVISNWLIGNEVNDEYAYYNVGATDMEGFIQTYMRTFRVMYNAIRSINATSDVYMTLANMWCIDREFVRDNANNATDAFPGRWFVEDFNTLAKQQGNFDWSIAFHPYSYPLDEADVLDDSGFTYIDRNNQQKKYVSDSDDTFQITMKNIDVLTDYLKDTKFIAPDGEVRSVILSEQGYTSKSNGTEADEVTQAASIAYAYYKAEANPYIDAFILFRYQDSTSVLNQQPHWAYGLVNVDGTKKYAYHVYKYIDSSDSLDYTQFALKLYGVNSWDELITAPSEYSDFESFVKSFPSYHKGSFIKVNALNSSGTALSSVSMNADDWKMAYNMLAMTQYNWNPAGGANYTSQSNTNIASSDRANNYWAVTSDEATYGEYKIISRTFESALNLSSQPYFGFTLEIDKDIDYYKYYSSKTAPTSADVIVRLYSDASVYEASANITVGSTYFSSPYNLYMNLQDWEGRKHITGMEVWVIEANGTPGMVAEISINNLQKASSVTGGTTMNTLQKSGIDLQQSGFSISAIGNQNYNGKEIEPSFTVSGNGKTLAAGKDYLYDFHNNKNGGTARLVVVGIGEYAGYLNTTFAISAPSFQVTFNPGELGTTSVSSKMVVVGNSYGELPVASRPGYVFKGWYTYDAGGDKITSDTIVQLTADQTLYAQYSVDTVTVTFDANGGSVSPSKMNFEYDTTYENLPVPVRAGYSFKGWLLNGKDWLINGQPVLLTEDTTVVAQWEEVSSAAVHFNGNGGSIDYSKVSSIDGLNSDGTMNKIALSYYGELPTAVRIGYQFAGWYNAEGQRVNYLTTVPAEGSISLTAHWIVNTPAGFSLIGPDGVDYSLVFDPAWYLANNEDVYNAYGQDYAAAFNHFYYFGMPEGRQGIGSFNVVNFMYCLLNDDLRATYGGDMRQYYLYYIIFGHAEGRSISDYDEIFNPGWYLANNPDVYANVVGRFTSDGNLFGWALWHYYEYGMNEGRQGCPKVAVLNYLIANEDVFYAYCNDNDGDGQWTGDLRAVIVQYAQYGQYENRSTTGAYDVYDMPNRRKDVVEYYGINNPLAWINWYFKYGR